MKATPLLAALLMLGGVSYASAQEGPPEGSRGASERGSPAAQERGSGTDARVTDRSTGADQDAGENESGANQKGRSAEGSDRAKEKGSPNRAAGDQPSGTKSKSTAKSDSDEAAGSKRMSREGSDSTDKSARTKGAGATEETDRSATDTSKGTTTDRSAEGKASGDKPKVNLAGEKRTQVQAAFRDAGNVKHRTTVDIDISVGRRLPRDWDFVPVPSAVVAIVPEYSGYYFAYVEDEYVIVEPDTYEVVAVLPAERSQASTSSGRQAPGSDQCPAQLTLSSKERELVIDNIKGGREADVGNISVGLDVPKGVDLLRFPDNVIAEAKALEGCQYFDAGDQIAIVDPDEDKIVAVIDKTS